MDLLQHSNSTKSAKKVLQRVHSLATPISMIFRIAAKAWLDNCIGRVAEMDSEAMQAEQGLYTTLGDVKTG